MAKSLSKPLLAVDVKWHDNSCPFTNKHLNFSLNDGQCLWLRGPSGCGKTSLASAIASLDKLRGAQVMLDWHENIRKKECVGILFQQGVLIDSLNVYDNIALSRKTAGLQSDRATLNKYLTAVGLAESDGNKMPGQLSGGMLRRAALAQILAQQKKIIILDEPFVGLDQDTALGIIELLKTLRDDRGQCFILITHEDHYGEMLATSGLDVTLTPKKPEKVVGKKRIIANWRFSVRLAKRFGDYFFISLPMIVFAYVATGLAVSMLFLQIMHSINLYQILQQYVHKAHLSFFESIGYAIIRPEIKSLSAQYMPLVKQKMFNLVMIQSFVLQLSPLLTGLLLVGRIGGSYTGEVAMMQATKQNALLRTLSISPQRWSLVPAAIAALVAAPLLNFIGSVTALVMADIMGSQSAYALYHHFGEFLKTIGPQIWQYQHFWSYPLLISLYRSLGFMAIILIVSEIAGRLRAHLQPRHVPKSITWSIVTASLLILLADWSFTEIYINLPY